MWRPAPDARDLHLPTLGEYPIVAALLDDATTRTPILDTGSAREDLMVVECAVAGRLSQPGGVALARMAASRRPLPNIESGWFPNLAGTEQLRYFRFDAERLVLDADTSWVRVKIIWERARRSSVAP
jgi:hypothetical protein